MFGVSLHVFGWGGVAFLVLPLIIASVASFGNSYSLRFPPESWSLRWYRNLVTNEEWLTPLANSLIFGVSVGTISVLIGLAGAYGSLYLRRSLRVVLLFLFMLPAVVPPVVIGVGQLLFFSRVGIIDTTTGVVFSHVALAYPFAFLVILTAIGRRHLELEDIATIYGARRWYAFLTVTLPMLKRALAGAFLLAFIISFDEAVVVLFITNHKAKTLPRQVFDGLRYDLDPTVAAVAGLATLFWLLVVVVLSLRRARVA
jgi:putative spermidine/putrescine transport system permease protein